MISGEEKRKERIPIKSGEIPDELRKSIQTIFVERPELVQWLEQARAEMIENWFKLMSRISWQRRIEDWVESITTAWYPRKIVAKIEEPLPSQYQRQLQTIRESAEKISGEKGTLADVEDLIKGQQEANHILERMLEAQIRAQVEAERTRKIERILTLIALLIAIMTMALQAIK